MYVLFTDAHLAGVAAAAAHDKTSYPSNIAFSMRDSKGVVTKNAHCIPAGIKVTIQDLLYHHPLEVSAVIFL